MNGYGYRFFDSDESGFEERDISGADLDELLDVCFKYSEYVSFAVFNNKVNGFDKLNRFRIKKPEQISICSNVSPQYQIQYFRLHPELKCILKEISDGIFGFVYSWGFNNPEDPYFYRADGSIFFKSEIHEGEILLSPKDIEDVSSIVSKPNWIKPEDYRNPFETSGLTKND